MISSLVLGAILLISTVAVALRLLLSGHMKTTLYGIGLVVLIGLIAPVLIPAFLPIFFRGVVIVLAVLGLIAILVFIVHVIADAI